MSRIKSLITRIEIDKALKKHSCRANANRPIVKGQRRLKVRDGRSWCHYCLECAKIIFDRDIKKLQEVEQNLVEDS